MWYVGVVFSKNVTGKMMVYGIFKKLIYLGNMNLAEQNSPSDMNRNENCAEKTNHFYISKCLQNLIIGKWLRKFKKKV